MKWIKIEDRLPTKEEMKACGYKIIIYDTKEGVCESYYRALKKCNFDHPYYGQDCLYYFEDVTHWAIPEPPKECN